MSGALRFLAAMKGRSAENPDLKLYSVYADCRLPFSMTDVRRVYQALMRVTGADDMGNDAPLSNWGMHRSHHATLKAIYDAIDLIAAEDMTPTAADFAGTADGLFLAT